MTHTEKHQATDMTLPSWDRRVRLWYKISISKPRTLCAMALPMPPIPNIPIFFPSGFIPMKIPAFHRPVCKVQGEYKNGKNGYNFLLSAITFAQDPLGLTDVTASIQDQNDGNISSGLKCTELKNADIVFELTIRLQQHLQHPQRQVCWRGIYRALHWWQHQWYHIQHRHCKWTWGWKALPVGIPFVPHPVTKL